MTTALVPRPTPATTNVAIRSLLEAEDAVMSSSLRGEHHNRQSNGNGNSPEQKQQEQLRVPSSLSSSSFSGSSRLPSSSSSSSLEEGRNRQFGDSDAGGLVAGVLARYRNAVLAPSSASSSSQPNSSNSKARFCLSAGTGGGCGLPNTVSTPTKIKGILKRTRGDMDGESGGKKKEAPAAAGTTGSTTTNNKRQRQQGHHQQQQQPRHRQQQQRRRRSSMSSTGDSGTQCSSTFEGIAYDLGRLEAQICESARLELRLMNRAKKLRDQRKELSARYEKYSTRLVQKLRESRRRRGESNRVVEGSTTTPPTVAAAASKGGGGGLGPANAVNVVVAEEQDNDFFVPATLPPLF